MAISEDGSKQLTIESCAFCETQAADLRFRVSDDRYVYDLCSWLCVMAFAAKAAQDEGATLRKRISDLEYENAHYRSGCL